MNLSSLQKQAESVLSLQLVVNIQVFKHLGTTSGQLDPPLDPPFGPEGVDGVDGISEELEAGGGTSADEVGIDTISEVEE